MRVIDFVIKELLQLRRDRRMFNTLFIVPLLQLALFGYALSTDVKHLGLAVCDQDKSQQSRRLIQAMTSSQYFDYRGAVDSPTLAQSLLTSGRADVVVVIPPEYQQKVEKGQTAPVQALVDGSNPNSGTLAAGYLAAIVQSSGAQLLTQRLERTGAPAIVSAGIDARLRVWYNPALETSLTMVPGVICTVIGMMTMFMAGGSVVKEREDGTIEQLIVTPLNRWELMLGKTIPVVLVGYVEMFTVIAAGVFLFGVPFRGSLSLLILLTAPFLVASLGIGLVISTVSRTQQQAAMALSFFATPNMLLSGFIFPIKNMPYALQLITYLLPMRYYLIVVRSIMLKGVGMAVLWPETVALCLLSAAMLAAAVWRFRTVAD